MALSLLFNRKVEESIAGVNVDTNISEIHRYQSQVTRFPVESGSSISDHIFNEPIQLITEPIVSDNPIQLVALGSDLVDMISGQASRSKTAAEELIRIRNERQVFTVVTGLKVYENMAFSDLEFKYNETTGKAIRFSAAFVEVEVVESRTIGLERDQLSDEFEEQAALVDQGKQTAEDITDLPGGSSNIFNFFIAPLRRALGV